MTKATATDAPQMKIDLLNALKTLENFSPEAEAAACLASAKRFATMKRIVFDTRIAGLVAEAESDGERFALAEIGRRGPRALARLLLEEAKALGPGGGLRVAREQMIRDLKKQLQ